MMPTQRLPRVLVYGDIGGSGGYIRYCKGLFASGFSPNDIELTFICSPQLYEDIKPLDKNIGVITHSWPASQSRIRRYLWQLLVYPNLITKIQPDLEFYPSGQVRAYFRKANMVTACHNLLPFDSIEIERFKNKEERQNFYMYKNRQTSSFNRSAGMIFFSNHSCEVVSKQVPGIKKIAIIPHGLEAQFRFLAPRTYEFGSQINILYVSSIYPYKNHLDVILAVKMIREITGSNVHLRLVGGGNQSELDRLEERILQTNSTAFVNLIGEVDRRSLLEEYHQADIFIFASSCETFGITLLEAMGARLPIACSNRSGLPDILSDAGVYFDPEDYHSIADALHKLITNQESRKELGEKAYGYSQEYTWERCAQQTYEFVRKVSKNN